MRFLNAHASLAVADALIQDSDLPLGYPSAVPAADGSRQLWERPSSCSKPAQIEGSQSVAEPTHPHLDAAAGSLRCVVAWFESRTQLFHFFWRESASGASERIEAHLLEASPRHIVAALMMPEQAVEGDGRHVVAGGLSAAEHPSFAEALEATSAPAHLVTLQSDNNPLASEQHAELLRRVLLSKGSEQQKQRQEILRCGPFAQAARRLGPGPDRRVLQMAVQYLAQGGIDESVVAALYDQEDFLEGVRRELESKKGPKPH